MKEICLTLSDRIDTLKDSTVKKTCVFITRRSCGPLAISEWVRAQSLLLAQQLAISFHVITVRGFVSAG